MTESNPGARDMPQAPIPNSHHSEHSEEPYAKRCDEEDLWPAETFNHALDCLLAGDLSGLDDIEPDLRGTAQEMIGLARTAGWLEPQLTPSADSSVPVDEDRVWLGHPATLPALNGHVRPRTANRATGPREVTMQVTAIPTTPPISHRMRGHSKPAITRAPRFPLSGIANAAIVVLLVLAGFGAWRVIDGGGGNGPAPSGGHYALAPMTPVPAATASSGNAASACDFSDEVPVYNGVDEPPVDGTVIYVTTAHELMLRCDEEPEDVLLARDVDSASPTGWPGVLGLGIGAGDYAPTPMLLNLQTNESIEFTFTYPTMTQVRDIGLGFTGQSPFVATALVDEPSTWTLTDQRTMETRTLSDLGGAEWPRNTPVYISDNGPQGTYAIAVHDSSVSTNHQPALTQPEGFPGEILLVSGSLDNSLWIDIPDDMSTPTSVTISPDGRYVAVLGKDHPQTPGRVTISIIRTSDNAELTRTESFIHTAMPNIIWVNDGDALVYPASGALMKLDAEQGSTPQALLESSGSLFALSATHGPDVVTISETTAPMNEWRGESYRVYAVNTRTGTVEELEGRTPQAIPSSGNAFGVQSAIILIEEDASGNVSTRVVDPSTGEILIEGPFAPSDDPAWLGDRTEAVPVDSLALSMDRGVTAFTMRDHRSLMVANVAGSSPSAREIAFPEFTPPEGDWSTQVRLSPAGSTVQLSIYTNQANMQWMLDLTDPDATWEAIPAGVWVEFMPAMP